MYKLLVIENYEYKKQVQEFLEMSHLTKYLSMWTCHCASAKERWHMETMCIFLGIEQNHGEKLLYSSSYWDLLDQLKDTIYFTKLDFVEQAE